MRIKDKTDTEIENSIRGGIECTFDSHDIALIGVKDIDWSEENDYEDDEPQIHIQANTICFSIDKDCTIDITTETYVLSEEAFLSTCADYSTFFPDIDWSDGTPKKLHLSDELPIGVDLMIIRYLNEFPEDLVEFLLNQKKPDKFIQKINSKPVRDAVKKLWQTAKE